MEIALSQFCGPDDIITPISKKEEVMRKSLFVRPCNYNGYWNHMSATSVLERVGSKIWDSYFKFCFERNPWDKMVSYYFHKRIGNLIFKDFVKSCVADFLILSATREFSKWLDAIDMP